MSDGLTPASAAHPWHELVVGALVTWRITHLLWAEDGPGDVVARLRERAGSRWWGQLMDCFSCLSIWVALPFAVLLGRTVEGRLLLWPALSGGAIVVERTLSCMAEDVTRAQIADRLEAT